MDHWKIETSPPLATIGYEGGYVPNANVQKSQFYPNMICNKSSIKRFASEGTCRTYYVSIVQGGCTNGGLSMTLISKTQVDVWGVGVNTVETRAGNEPSQCFSITEKAPTSIFANDIARPLWSLSPLLNFMSIYCGLTPVQHSVLIDS